MPVLTRLYNLNIFLLTITMLAVSSASMANEINLRNSTDTCVDTTNEGAIRFLDSSNEWQVCNGSAWVTFANNSGATTGVMSTNIPDNTGSYTALSTTSGSNTSVSISSSNATGEGGNIELLSNDTNLYDANTHYFRDVDGSPTFATINSNAIETLGDSSSPPKFQWYNSSAAVDDKIWRIEGQTDGKLAFQIVNDAYSVVDNKMLLARDGTLVLRPTGSEGGHQHCKMLQGQRKLVLSILMGRII